MSCRGTYGLKVLSSAIELAARRATKATGARASSARGFPNAPERLRAAAVAIFATAAWAPGLLPARRARGDSPSSLATWLASAVSGSSELHYEADSVPKRSRGTS